MAYKVDGPCLTALVRRSLERLADNGISQARIERAIGLADGYLSRLKKGRPVPRPPLALLLHVLARNPKSIEIVERFWLTLPTKIEPAPTEQS